MPTLLKISIRFIKRWKKRGKKCYLWWYLSSYFRNKCKTNLSRKSFQLFLHLTARQKVGNSSKITLDLHSSYKSKSYLSWMIWRLNLWHPPWQRHQDTTNTVPVMTVERWENAKGLMWHYKKMLNVKCTKPKQALGNLGSQIMILPLKSLDMEKGRLTIAFFLIASFFTSYQSTANSTFLHKQQHKGLRKGRGLWKLNSHSTC